jgi:hypothetical protein
MSSKPFKLLQRKMKQSTAPKIIANILRYVLENHKVVV